jgi:selenocysteine lyase/cysteine desulfurase
VVDGVSYAPHGLPDIPALGCDVYLFSTYKTYGPHQGIMVIRESMGWALPAQGHHFNADVLYKRFTPSGPDHAQIAACAGMADYIDALAAQHGIVGDAAARSRAVHDLMRAAEVAVVAPLLDYLAARNDVRLVGPRDAAARAPTVAVELAGAAEPVARALGDLGINCGGSNFYGVRPLQAMGIDPDKGVLRLSLVHYTTTADVSRAIEALDRVL